jgi:hypothetical protein
MAEQTDNLVLDILRALRADMSAMREDFRDFKVRQNDMALSLAAMRRDQANDAGVSAHLQAQFDRLKEEVELIKRRLDIAPAK